MQHMQYLKPRGPLMRTVAALSGFPCLGSQFFVIIGFLLFSGVVSVPCLCAAKRRKMSECGAGGNGTFDFLFTLGAIETRRCKRISDIESVQITKTGIKGD